MQESGKLKFKQKLVKLIRISILLLFCFILATVIINLIIIFTSKKSIYSSSDSIPDSYAVMVPGARVYQSGKISTILYDRVMGALELYKKGKVKKFLLSGDHGRKSYDEVNAMRKFLLNESVPAEDIFLDHAGFETYDSIYRAKEIFLIKDMVICTQEFHLSRCIYIADNLKIKSTGYIADRNIYLSAYRDRFREYFARVKIFFKLLIKPRPKFLGDTIPIDGDSRKSWDKFD